MTSSTGMTPKRFAPTVRGLLLAGIAVAACAVSERAPDAGPPSAAPAPSRNRAPRAQASAFRAAYVAARQEAADATYAVIGNGAEARGENPAMDASVAFGAAGMSLGAASGKLELQLRSVGCDGASVEVTAPVPHAEKNRASFAHRLPAGVVEEWYVNGPMGVEQGFTLSDAVACAEQHELVLDVRTRGVTPRLAVDGSVDLTRDDGAVAYHYTDLRAVDAAGRELPGHMEATADSVRLVVDARGATYPVVVDPLVWTQQQELTAGDPATSENFGSSVSVSGTMALVGAPGGGTSNDAGGAYVFVQSGTAWTQAQKLTPTPLATSSLSFGSSVSLDGNIAVVGQVGGGNASGAAYVFVQSGTTWTQQQRLSVTGASANFGRPVSVSGTTVLVGADDQQVGANAAQGAVYVFVQSGTTWTEQQELTAGDGAANGAFGGALSLDGNIAVIGAQNTASSSDNQGYAYVFVRAGTTWTEQQKLTASDGVSNDHLSQSIHVSGTTAIVSSAAHNNAKGAAYVFVQSGTTWTEQQELTAVEGASGDFGWSVGLDGDTAVVGALNQLGAGSAYVFGRTGTTWTQEQALTSSDGTAGDDFGIAVSISGNLVVAGASTHGSGGSAYVFAGETSSGSTSSTSASASGSGSSTSSGGSGGSSATTTTTATGSSSASGAGGASAGGSTSESGSCSCRLAESEGGSERHAAWFGLALAVVGMRRRWGRGATRGRNHERAACRGDV